MSDDFNVEDYEDLMGMGFDRKPQKPPEEEFFHAVYISGQDRKNHIDVVERAGKLQIRGSEYNLDEVNMIITIVKPVLVKNKIGTDNREVTECFSFLYGNPPYTGTSGRTCGSNAAERAAVDYCKDCRSQLIVAGIRCTEQGSPILDSEKKPVFIFLRGKGMKYSSISEYLTELQNTEFTPLLQEKDKEFERKNLNNKRVVTKVTVTEVGSSYGPKKVYKLDRGVDLPSNATIDVLKISKKTLDAFREKFDLSLNWKNQNVIGSTPEKAEEGQAFHLGSDSESKNTDENTNTKEDGGNTSDSMFDFDSLEF